MNPSLRVADHSRRRGELHEQLVADEAEPGVGAGRRCVLDFHEADAGHSLEGRDDAPGELPFARPAGRIQFHLNDGTRLPMANGQNETQPAKIVWIGRLRANRPQVCRPASCRRFGRMAIGDFVVSALSGREGRTSPRPGPLASCRPSATCHLSSRARPISSRDGSPSARRGPAGARSTRIPGGESSRRPRRRRDTAGSTPECSDRCRGRGGGPSPSAEPTTVR